MTCFQINFPCLFSLNSFRSYYTHTHSLNLSTFLKCSICCFTTKKIFLVAEWKKEKNFSFGDYPCFELVCTKVNWLCQLFYPKVGLPGDLERIFTLEERRKVHNIFFLKDKDIIIKKVEDNNVRCSFHKLSLWKSNTLLSPFQLLIFSSLSLHFSLKIVHIFLGGLEKKGKWSNIFGVSCLVGVKMLKRYTYIIFFRSSSSFYVSFLHDHRQKSTWKWWLELKAKASAAAAWQQDRTAAFHSSLVGISCVGNICKVARKYSPP